MNLDDDFMAACLSLAGPAGAGGPAAAARRVLDMVTEGRALPPRLAPEAALFAAACRHLGVADDRPAVRRLRALALREETRARMVEAQYHEASAALAAFGAAPLRGPALAAAVWPGTWLRHSHGLTFLLPDADGLGGAVAALRRLGWRREGAADPLSPHHTVLAGEGRAEAVLETRLFAWEAQVPSEIPAELALAEIVGHALTGPHGRNRRWMADAVFLAAKGGLDPEAAAGEIGAHGFAGSAAAMLSEAEALAPEGPGAVLAAVRAALRGGDGPAAARAIELRALTRASPAARAARLARRPWLIGDALRLMRAARAGRRRAEALRARLRAPD